jgi:hypothetical protein
MCHESSFARLRSILHDYHDREQKFSPKPSHADMYFGAIVQRFGRAKRFFFLHLFLPIVSVILVDQLYIAFDVQSYSSLRTIELARDGFLNGTMSLPLAVTKPRGLTACVQRHLNATRIPR